MKLPIGCSNFRSVIERKLYFVDKSLFIADVIDDRGANVIVITRPHHFGKTFNLSMLHHFLASEVNGRPTNSLFDNLKIKNLGSKYMEYQGQRPVIFITFNSVKNDTYCDAFRCLRIVIGHVFGEHRYLLESPSMSTEDKDFFRNILREKVDKISLLFSIGNLTRYLYYHHGMEPWLLIDEYDTPIYTAFLNGYYEQMLNLMRGCLGIALKDNDYLYRSVITGRIAKGSLFSGVNYLSVYSLLQNEYSQHFGFTEEEVYDILKRSNLDDKLDEVRKWYNGYQVGKSVVYNPCSIVNFAKSKGIFGGYWVNASDNILIRDLLLCSGPEVKLDLDKLLKEEPIEKFIDENATFGDLRQSESSIWSLFFSSGYLKVKEQHLIEADLKCTLDIPNYEVRRLYVQVIFELLSNGQGINWSQSFINNLLTGNIDLFKEKLTRIMEERGSLYDISRNHEAFYQILMIGLTASLNKNTNYELSSNQESGYGRYDYFILSKNSHCHSILIEIKKIEQLKLRYPSKIGAKLRAEARKGLLRIDELKNVTGTIQRGNENILKVSIAFSGKRFEIQHEYVQ